jgi:hypothetical protein
VEFSVQASSTAVTHQPQRCLTTGHWVGACAPIVIYSLSQPGIAKEHSIHFMPSQKPDQTVSPTCEIPSVIPVQVDHIWKKPAIGKKSLSSSGPELQQMRSPVCARTTASLTVRSHALAYSPPRLRPS